MPNYAMGNLYDDPNYPTGGAAGGTFAPAYIPGDPRSQAAVSQWQGNRGQGNLGGVDMASLRMPDVWQQPQADAMTGMMQPIVPGTQTYGTGATDPAALRAMAWNTPYDVDARRNEIAQRVMANQQAQEAYNTRVAEQPQQPAGISREDEDRIIQRAEDERRLRWISDVSG